MFGPDDITEGVAELYCEDEVEVHVSGEPLGDADDLTVIVASLLVGTVSYSVVANASFMSSYSVSPWPMVASQSSVEGGE